MFSLNLGVLVLRIMNVENTSVNYKAIDFYSVHNTYSITTYNVRHRVEQHCYNECFLM